MTGNRQQPYLSKGWIERKGQNSFFADVTQTRSLNDGAESKKRKKATDEGPITSISQLIKFDLSPSSPDETTAGNADRVAVVLTQHFLSEFAQGGPKSSKKFGQSEYEREHMQSLLWTKATESLLLYNAILLLSATHYAQIHQLNSASYRDSKVLVLTLLNDMLASPDVDQSQSDEVIATVSILAGLDFYYGDKDSFYRKLSQLDRIVSNRGGLERIADFAKMLILATGIDLSNFQNLETPFKSASSSTCPRIGGVPDNFALPIGFHELCQQCYLRSEVGEIIKPLAIMAIPAMTTSVEPLEAVEDWLLDPESMGSACCFSPFQSRADDSVVSLAHKAVRLGCLSFIQALKSSASNFENEIPSPKKPSVGPYVDKLAHEVCSELLVRSIYAELTLWALFSFTSIPNLRTFSLPHATSKFALTLMDELRIEKFEQLIALLSCFLYLPELQTGPLKKAWLSLMERKDAEVSVGATDSLQEQTVPMSRFDKKAIKRTRPNVPDLSNFYK